MTWLTEMFSNCIYFNFEKKKDFRNDGKILYANQYVNETSFNHSKLNCTKRGPHLIYKDKHMLL